MARLQSRQHGDGEDLLVVQNSKDLKGHLIEDASDYVKLGLLSTLLYAEVPFVIAIVTATEQTNYSTNAELLRLSHAPSGMSYQPVELYSI